MDNIKTEIEKQAWFEWERANKELADKGGVNPHAFVLGFKYGAKYSSGKQVEIAEKALKPKEDV